MTVLNFAGNGAQFVRSRCSVSGGILIEPTEYDTNACQEYKEVLRLITRNEEKLLATMSDEQKELFSRYTDAVREYQTMAECLLFQSSFRLGAKMMLEVMEE